MGTNDNFKVRKRYDRKYIEYSDCTVYAIVYICNKIIYINLNFHGNGKIIRVHI